MERRTFLHLTLAGVTGALLARDPGDDLQAALDAAAADGAPLVLPAGRFVLSRALRVPASGLAGAGEDLTELVAAPGVDGPLLVAADGSFDLAGLTVRGGVTTRVGAAGARFHHTS